MSDLVAGVLVVIGSLLALLAGIGLHRFPDVFARMHAATKPATLGLVLVLASASLRLSATDDIIKVLLVIALQFITAPVGAHLVGRAAYRAGTELSEQTLFDDLSQLDLDLLPEDPPG